MATYSRTDKVGFPIRAHTRIWRATNAPSWCAATATFGCRICVPVLVCTKRPAIEEFAKCCKAAVGKRRRRGIGVAALVEATADLPISVALLYVRRHRVACIVVYFLFAVSLLSICVNLSCYFFSNFFLLSIANGNTKMFRIVRPNIYARV